MDNMTYPVILTLMVPKETKSYRHVYFICFLALYVLILSINICLVMVILMEKALHEPMYIFLCHVCINGIYGATGFYPKILSDLILDSYVISFHMCALQTYVIYSFLLSEITILTVMSYDRYVAICKPLDYHSKLTKNTCVKLILFSWIVPSCICITAVLLSNLRPICKYHIDKLYCDNWSVVKLACVSSFVNNVFGYVITVMFFSFIVLIIVSYFKLISACKASLESRRKFWQTCLPHILSLINFTSAYFFDIMYSRYGSNDIPESLRNFLALELVIVPPVFNPLIYGLNITVVRKRVFTLCIQQKEPVPWADLEGDLLQYSHSEWPFHEGTVQASEIEDGPQAGILFGDEEKNPKRHSGDGPPGLGPCDN
ncbi:olfactory receptor 52Z1-like [Cyprinus carpio]|uniref:Olfactory receptor 52Z1-like n=1 Tax=Cyprinus carpio TaxID=7962 RepID=A0A9Q9VCI0_CYPCA|nr:olfactory receptor 52Z1-like [Cyprinus carpio]